MRICFLVDCSKENPMFNVHKKTAAGLSMLLVIALTLGSTIALQRSAHTQARVVGTPVSLGEILIEDERPRLSKEDILWLARCIYSETKRPHEQELVAWVVRNRVETTYRGSDTYEDVVLDPYQFSAFNPGSRKRSHYSSLEWSSTAAGFQVALSIAAKVATSDPAARPFSETTRHFYSRRSMRSGLAPFWAHHVQPVALDWNVEPDRFQFFDRVA